MPDADLILVHIGFRGGEVLAARVSVAGADALETAFRARTDEVIELEAEDGRLLVAVSMVSYVKRHAREGRVGFTS